MHEYRMQCLLPTTTTLYVKEGQVTKNQHQPAWGQELSSSSQSSVISILVQHHHAAATKQPRTRTPHTDHQVASSSLRVLVGCGLRLVVAGGCTRQASYNSIVE